MKLENIKDQKNSIELYRRFIILKASICAILSLLSIILISFIGGSTTKLFTQILAAKVIIIIYLIISVVLILLCLFVKFPDKYYHIGAKISDIAFYIGDVIAVIYVLFVLVISPVRVIGSSMEDTYYENDRLMVSRIFYSIDRDDVVILHHDEDELWVKRVAGLPGDIVSYQGDDLYINEVKVDVMRYGMYENDEYIIKPGAIPDDYYLVLGDNRSVSYDSRAIGLINRDEIVGEVICRIKKG